MRAKFINEKFEEHSDPIHDMGIGEEALAELSDEFFDALKHRKRAEPANFPWNCYFLTENGNEVGFFYKYGDYIHIYSYFETPDNITEIGDYIRYLKRTDLKLKRISKDILRKTKTFQEYNRQLDYNEHAHPPLGE
jgi:hypothetical protein